MTKPMTDREYADECGTKCPFCKSENVQSDNIEVDGPTAWTDDECDDCGKTWTSQYALRGYVSHDNNTH